MIFRYLLPRHYVALVVMILILAFFIFLRWDAWRYEPALVKSFEAATVPSATLSLPCDIQVELGDFNGQKKEAFAVWLRKKDGFQYMFRLLTPPRAHSFCGPNVEILPKTDPHTSQFPNHFNFFVLAPPTVMPTPPYKATDKVTQLGIGVEMKTISANFTNSDAWEGPFPYYYKNLTVQLHLKEMSSSKPAAGFRSLVNAGPKP